MAFLARGKKQDLIELAENLNVEIEENFKVLEIKDAIIKNPAYDSEFTKECLNRIINDRKELELRSERENERLFELEKLKLQASSSNNKNSGEVSASADSEMPKLEIHKLIPSFDSKTTDMSLFLDLFEKQLTFLKVPLSKWVFYLVGLLPTDIANLIAKESMEGPQSYEKVKQILLNRFKLSAEKFRQKFAQHRKNQDSTWRDFYFDLQSYFDGWLKESKVTTFQELKDLILADQIKKRAPPDYKDHFLDQWCEWNNPLQLADKLDSYEDVRSMRSKHENKNFDMKQKEIKSTQWRRNNPRNPNPRNEQFLSGFPSQSRRETGVLSKSRWNPTSNDRTHGRNFNEKSEERNPISCYGCGAPGTIKSKCRICNPIQQKDENFSSNINQAKFYSFSKENTPISIIEVTICETKVAVCADSGATHTVAGEKMYQLLRQHGLKFEEKNIEMTLADGLTQKTTILTTIADINVQGKVVSTELIVLKNAKGNRTLLGMDFLIAAGIVLDLQKKNWYFTETPHRKYGFVEAPPNINALLAVNEEPHPCHLRENEGAHLSLQEQKELNLILEKYERCFQPGGEPTTFIEHHIKTIDHLPIAVPPYRMNPSVIAMDTHPSDSDPPVPEPSQQEIVVTTPDPSDQNNHHPDCLLSTTRTPPTNGTSCTTSSSRTPLTQPSVQTLANLLEEVMRITARVLPCIERCRDVIRNHPVLSGRHLGEVHHLFSRVSQLMHFLSHAYHSLSDLHINFSQPPPRSPRVRIISSTHSSSLFQGIPMQTRPVPISRITTPIITSVTSAVPNPHNPLFVQRTHNPVVLMEVSPTLSMDNLSSLAPPVSSANGTTIVLPTTASDSPLPRIQSTTSGIIPSTTATVLPTTASDSPLPRIQSTTSGIIPSTTATENISPAQSNETSENSSNPPRSTTSGATSSGSGQGPPPPPPPPINIPFRNLIPVPLTSMGSLHTFDSGLPCHSVWALEPSRRRHNAGNARTPPNAQNTVSPNAPGRQEDQLQQVVSSIMTSLLNHVPSQDSYIPAGFSVFTSRADDSTAIHSNSTNQATQERASRAQNSEHSYANRLRRSSAYENTISLFNSLDISNMNVTEFLASININLRGILGEFLNHLGNILTMKDIVDIAHGMNEAANKLREPGREYLKKNVFQSENPDQHSIKTAVQQIIKETENGFRLFMRCVKVRDRKYSEVIVSLFQRSLRSIFGIFLSNSEFAAADFGTRLVEEVQKYLRLFMQENERHTHDANSVIETKCREYIKHLAPGTCTYYSKVRAWLLAMVKKFMRKFSPVNLSDGKAKPHGSESTASRNKGTGATQKKPNAVKTGISLPTRGARGNSGMRRRNFVEALGVNEALASGISRNRSTPTLAAFARIAEQTSALLRTNGPQTDSQPNIRNLTEVVIGPDSWHNSVPQDWVPIITRDVHRQRRQAAQAPFSNGYLSGMPSKRRRIMNGNPTLLAPSKGALPEMLLQAISNAKVNPVTNMELLKNEAMKDVTLQSSFHKHMKNSIQERLQHDLDYCSERFPNSEKYFN